VIDILLLLAVRPPNSPDDGSDVQERFRVAPGSPAGDGARDLQAPSVSTAMCPNGFMRAGRRVDAALAGPA